MRKFTDTEKIEILETVKKYLQDKRDTEAPIYAQAGLCAYMYRQITSYQSHIHAFDISNYFSDFTKRNALKFGAKYEINRHWWDYIPYDYENRLAFLDWMITRIKEGKEGK
jgi:hypothetical protein